MMPPFAKWLADAGDRIVVQYDSRDLITRDHTGGAVFSACGRYRYVLFRRWASSERAVFVMLNPSTADERENDPTVKRCIEYARAWGYGGLIVLNLFALRSTDPRALLGDEDPEGPMNDSALTAVFRSLNPRSHLVVCAWGVRGGYRSRSQFVLGLMDACDVVPRCLRITKDGFPEHPLYLPGVLTPSPYPGAEADDGG